VGWGESVAVWCYGVECIQQEVLVLGGWGWLVGVWFGGHILVVVGGMKAWLCVAVGVRRAVVVVVEIPVGGWWLLRGWMSGVVWFVG